MKWNELLCGRANQQKHWWWSACMRSYECVRAWVCVRKYLYEPRVKTIQSRPDPDKQLVKIQFHDVRDSLNFRAITCDIPFSKSPLMLHMIWSLVHLNQRSIKSIIRLFNVGWLQSSFHSLSDILVLSFAHAHIEIGIAWEPSTSIHFFLTRVCVVFRLFTLK